MRRSVIAMGLMRMLPAGEATDVVGGQVVAHEGGVCVQADYAVDLEVELHVHLGEIAGDVLQRDLGDTPVQLVRTVGQRLAYHAGSEDLRS
jgi:hypothetical protein